MTKPKMQATLDGYLGWAFVRLVERTGEKSADIAKWIVREWLEQRADHLRDEYGISRDEWERATGGNVTNFQRNSK